MHIRQIPCVVNCVSFPALVGKLYRLDGTSGSGARIYIRVMYLMKLDSFWMYTEHMGLSFVLLLT